MLCKYLHERTFPTLLFLIFITSTTTGLSSMHVPFLRSKLSYFESEVGVKQLLEGCNVIQLSIQTSVQFSLHRFLLRLLKPSRSQWLCTALPFQLLTPLLPLSQPDKMTCQGADFFFVFSISWRVTGQTSYLKRNCFHLLSS